MINQRGVLSVLLLSSLLLTGCGSEKATDPAADPAAEQAADQAELAARASALGIAPEHVYVTEAPGFTLAQQSVGVLGDDGFSAVYVSRKTGAQLHLSVDRGTMTAETCAEGASAPCEKEGDAWYRGQEYAVPKKGHVVRVSGEGISRDVLREAAEAVHRPSDAELDTLLPPAGERGGGGSEPVERGDLPATGDGAPLNDQNATG
ncbi:hypothetical protein QNN03_28085 [Streptomyces sp. GXMU-J15]|uniref:Membrane lipoprotein n=1 Tax=Streptomyces fuscus TaxID=3048495 RepID=A0ABT7J619_9ACTN|nr:MULTISPECIES: hypothetical protein [Streptomyces]MDL2080310.1 hypothetical protein [Streptomyces fuscus]SBT88928.1 hypothetical protein GA0115233_1005109 [Streptomyces sp. DI166]